MKKYFVFLVCFLSYVAYAGEPLMLVKPSREIFVNFPSAILPDKAVSVFLPEEEVPLQKRYPVVYVLGAVPTDAAEVQKTLSQMKHKAIFVGLNVTDEDMKNPEKIVQFFSHELIPYIDTNYLTFDEPGFRVIAATGETGANMAAALLACKNLFTKVIILHGGENPPSLNTADNLKRILVVGARAELAAWTRVAQEQGLIFGPGFVTHISAEKIIFSVINLDYLFADEQSLQVAKLVGTITPSSLYIASDEKATFVLSSLLTNGMRFEPIILDLKLSPRYLDWSAEGGTLTSLPGASAGKVKITAVVDKKAFSSKIKLKK